MLYILVLVVFFFQAEDGIRVLVRSRGLGDVYKRQTLGREDCGRQQLPGRSPVEGCGGVRVGGLETLQDLSLIHI